MLRRTVLFVLAAAVCIAASGSLSAQLVPQYLYYKFNEGTGTSTANDGFPGAGAATVPFTGTLNWVTTGAKLGNSSLAFGNGTTAQGKLYPTWAPNLPSTQSWTLEFWMRYSGTTAQYICGDSTASTWRVYFFSGRISMRSGGFTIHDSTTTTLGNGQWNHCAFVYDAVAHTSRWYINGVIDSTMTNQNPNIVSTAFQIGNYSGTSYSYRGDLDEFRFWSVARTQAEIQAAMNVELNNGPTLTATVSTLNLGETETGTAGNAMSYDAGGLLLTAATTITAPAGIEVSFTQASGYASSIQVTQFPSFGPTTIYARIADTAPVGPITGDIVHSSPGATDKTIAVTADVLSLDASVAALNLGFTTIGVPGNPHSYDLTGDGLTAGTVLDAPPGVEIAFASTGPYSPALNIPTTPSFTQTVYVRLDGVAVGNYSGDVTNVSGPAFANVTVNGDVFPPDNLHAMRHGPSINLLVDNNSQGGANGLVLLDFSLSTINSAWTVTDLTFSASGTADEQAGLSSLVLYEDSMTGGSAGVFDGPFIDTIATTGSGVSFNGPNGDYTATLSNDAWPAATTRRFFLVCKLAGKAVAGETLHAELTGVTGSTASAGFITGVPTAHPVDAFTINAAQMTVLLNGPVVFAVVNNDAQGVGGAGLVVADFRIKPKNDGWTVNSLTFQQTGTIDGQAGVTFLGLYVDDGDGVWEGDATDVLATATTGVGFNAPQGVFQAGLTGAAGALGVNEVKRFFLVAKLAGNAQSGQTLRVSITGIAENAPTGGNLVGVPTGSTSALVIDQPTLTANAGPGNPTVVTRRKTGAGFTEMIGQVRLSASNSDFTVAGMTLHTAGNGDWLNHVDPATGVQVFRDNGNGTFDVGDIPLFAGAGATPAVVCAFTSQQTVSMSTDLDLWVVLNVLPDAGGSPYETFLAELKGGADVDSLTSGGTVKIGTLAPQSGELRVVDFRVDEFTPTVDLFAGGGSVKIEGSGFALPVNVTINGLPCTGTAQVSPDGTLISGLSVPAGTGTNLDIVLTTNNLAPEVLTQKFRYSSTLAVGPAASASEGSSCAASAGASLAMLALPALALAASRRRRE